LIAGDAADPVAWWNGMPFDRILIDAPCTASGVVRRHPDGKWLRRESDVESFVEQQRRLLDGLWATLQRGGKLLYSTCSLFRAENAQQVDAFLVRHSDASRTPLELPRSFAAEGGQVLPAAVDAEHNHDGFFYALLQKS
jgi:16S rRNA (cytosine967-C5)-methyltransferase